MMTQIGDRRFSVLRSASACRSRSSRREEEEDSEDGSGDDSDDSDSDSEDDSDDDSDEDDRPMMTQIGDRRFSVLRSASACRSRSSRRTFASARRLGRLGQRFRGRQRRRLGRGRQ
jgi:hypothetical protein